MEGSTEGRLARFSKDLSQAGRHGRNNTDSFVCLFSPPGPCHRAQLQLFIPRCTQKRQAGIGEGDSHSRSQKQGKPPLRRREREREREGSTHVLLSIKTFLTAARMEKGTRGTKNRARMSYKKEREGRRVAVLLTRRHMQLQRFNRHGYSSWAPNVNIIIGENPVLKNVEGGRLRYVLVVPP